MSGEGFMFDAIKSLKNNRGQMRRSNPFRKKVDEIHVHHIKSERKIPIDNKLIGEIGLKTKRQALKDQRITVITFAIILTALIVTALIVT